MKFIGYKELKEIEKDNKKLANAALLKSVIIGATVMLSLIIIAPVFHENTMFFSSIFGVLAFFSFYTTTIYEIKLLKELKKSDGEIDQEVNQSKDD